MARKVSRVEVEPVRFVKDGKEKYAEVTTPGKAHVWGVYFRFTNGMAEWQSDHKTKTKAIAVARRLATKRGVEAVVRKG